MNVEAGPQDDGAAPQQPHTAGALLRAAREAQGLHIAALAASIKVSPRKLEALEGDRFSELPDATFTRALAQTVCRTLKIDPRPVLERMPAAGPLPLVPLDTGLNEPFRDGAARNVRPSEDSVLSGLSMGPMFLGAGLLLVASVVLFLTPLDRWLALDAAPMPASVPAVRVPAAAASAAEVPASASALAGGQPVAAASEPGMGAASSPVAATRDSASVQLGPAAAPTAASAPGPELVRAQPASGLTAGPSAALQMQVREPSWIEVRDQRGAALLSRTVAPGEQLALDGAGPYVLVVGNAAATTLVFRGRPVDLAPHSRDNVARLSLP